MPPPHPDFARLRRFHNYYRVLSVGEYRHHINRVDAVGSQSIATAWIDPVRAFGGEERIRLQLSISTARHGDATFEATVAFRAPPLPPDAAGEIEVPATVSYVVTAGNAARGRPFAGTASGLARLVVDGDRVHVLAFGGAIPTHRFEAVDGSAFEIHLGFLAEN